MKWQRAKRTANSDRPLVGSNAKLDHRRGTPFITSPLLARWSAVSRNSSLGGSACLPIGHSGSVSVLASRSGT
jgi:hypothetical protein